MESRTETISMQLEDDIEVKVQASVLGGEVNVLDLEKVLPFKEVADAIEGIAGAVLATMQRVQPDRASVEFGVEVGIETGGVTALLVKGTGTGNLQITLEWDKDK